MRTLAERFEYDAWANLAWVESFATQKNAPAWKVAMHFVTEIAAIDDTRRLSDDPIEKLKHLLWVQGIWLVRIGGTEAPPLTSLPSEDRYDVLRREIDRLRREWLAFLTGHHHDQVFTVGDGRSQADLKLGDIATHVLEKSAYYRGQLDMLATYYRRDVPETGFLHYLRDREAGKLPA